MLSAESAALSKEGNERRVEVAALAAMAVLASWLLDTLRPWAIIGANFVAALVMLGILFRDHRVSVRELLTSGE